MIRHNSLKSMHKYLCNNFLLSKDHWQIWNFAAIQNTAKYIFLQFCFVLSHGAIYFPLEVLYQKQFFSRLYGNLLSSTSCPKKKLGHILTHTFVRIISYLKFINNTHKCKRYGIRNGIIMSQISVSVSCTYVLNFPCVALWRFLFVHKRLWLNIKNMQMTFTYRLQSKRSRSVSNQQNAFDPQLHRLNCK